jgi:hypothetical protein
MPSHGAAGDCNVECNAASPTVCTTNSGKFCVNLQNNPNFCSACNVTCPSDKNNRLDDLLVFSLTCAILLRSDGYSTGRQ